ncbi:MAG: isoprenylcysteine carboxylmethyltransferase family protein [Dehalococcoidia bacterium]|nr:isoprenylcysteine carboxylmethyltransferase family protein [Dehalococcoidia bacterium]
MDYDYGLWPVVAINVGIFIAFAFGVLRPKARREWHSLGVLSAFVVALFTEMYGFPLTIYLVSAFLGRLPADQPFSHLSGNLWASLFLTPAWGAVFMLVGGMLIGGGALLVSSAWRRIHSAHGVLVTLGPYAVMRHPQYAGLMLAILGALVQWPTVITLAMAPVLVAIYWRLARQEDRELEERFGERYRAYRERVRAFPPARLPFSNRQPRGYLGEVRKG